MQRQACLTQIPARSGQGHPFSPESHGLISGLNLSNPKERLLPKEAMARTLTERNFDFVIALPPPPPSSSDEVNWFAISQITIPIQKQLG